MILKKTAEGSATSIQTYEAPGTGAVGRDRHTATGRTGSGPDPHRGTFVTLTSLMRESTPKEQTLHPSMEIRHTGIMLAAERGTAGQWERTLSINGPGPPVPHLGKKNSSWLLLHIISKDQGGGSDKRTDSV